MELGYTEQQLAEEHAKAVRESEDNSLFRTFCLNNYLTLSEHSLICDCAASRKDDLTIPLSELPVEGKRVPRMLLYMNRIKSEFSIARALLYNALERDDWVLDDEADTEFVDLFEGEHIGKRAEALRTSFRVCFGILDKIAAAVCELYGLADANESIQFESFWRPRGKRLTSAQERRWNRLREIDNVSLVALYSQARDLNPKMGNWASFKNWRNAIEHGILIVRDPQQPSGDPMRVVREDRGDLVVPLVEFRNRARLMLRITRAAIFYFAFCVRTEGLRYTGGTTSPIVLGPKKLREEGRSELG